jgi:hypothetical protein
MKKFASLMTFSILISMMSFSQTTKQHIEKLSKDSKTAERAAKADVYILKNKKVISDTATQQVCDPKTSKKRKFRRKS